MPEKNKSLVQTDRGGGSTNNLNPAHSDRAEGLGTPY